ncbi:MAG: ABC transporter substrate-binding protein, partial [Flammeovirgaceae bacterium]|nr:ABC transporter substrate-binding protein [Flammeovirgaceae bacterium]
FENNTKNVVYRFLLLFLFVFTVASANAQSLLNNATKQYEYGVSLYKQEKYAAAFEVFNNLLVEADETMMPYVLYFQALSAYKDKKHDKALYALQNILERYEAWEKIDEANYLMAVILAEKGDIDGILQHVSLLKDSSVKEDATSLLKKVVKELDIPTLKHYYQKYPTNKIIGTRLMKELFKLPLSELDTVFYDELTAKFDEQKQYDRSLKIKALYKDTYSIVAFLPLFFQEFNPYDVYRKSIRTEEYYMPYDFYEGMKLAQKQLESEGVKLDIKVVDTRKDTLLLRKVLDEKSLIHADLFIGPFYRTQLSMVLPFAKTHTIPIVNPISANEEWLSSYPLFYSLFPSGKTQAKAVANFVFQQISKDKSPAYVLYHNRKEDKEMAQHYANAVKEIGGKVDFFEEFDYTNKRSFDKLIAKFTKLQIDSMAHIFVSVNDEIAAINVMSALQNLQLKNLVIVPESWVYQFNRLSLEELEKYRVHIIAPSYVNYSDTKVKKFHQEYLKKTNLTPSRYSYVGFEVIHAFGKLLKTYGKAFPQKLHTSIPLKGGVLSGYDFRNSNDNAYVPIVRFEKGELKWVNRELLE